MSLISIREYDRLCFGEGASSDGEPVISAPVAQYLRGLTRKHGFDVFKLSSETTLSSQQYVGVAQAGGVTVEILPKVEGIDGTTMRRNLVGMLSVALDLEISVGDMARVSTQKSGILEIFIRLFCEKLFAQVHRGLVRRYEAREENLRFLRGRLAVIEQARLNFTNPERLYCRFDELQEDNAMNQVLKAAVKLLRRISLDLGNQKKLNALSLVFEGVSDLPTRMLPLDRVSFDRMSDRYRASYKLAEMFLKNTPPDVGGGSASGYSIFFDMNVLFEEYIGRVAKNAFRETGCRVTLQGPKRFLARDETTSLAAFALKPDVVGTRNQKTEWIIDTKWKRLTVEKPKDGVISADVYQMYAYANCYACADVVLLYPHHSELDAGAGVRSSYTLTLPLAGSGGDDVRRIHVATIDLSDLSGVADQLRSAVAGRTIPISI